jgi:hypothetical protein
MSGKYLKPGSLQTFDRGPHSAWRATLWPLFVQSPEAEGCRTGDLASRTNAQVPVGGQKSVRSLSISINRRCPSAGGPTGYSTIWDYEIGRRSIPALLSVEFWFT